MQEIGESALQKYVQRWRNELPPDAIAPGYAALRDAITQRQAQRLGVAVDDWLSAPTYPHALLTRAHDTLANIDRDGFSQVWDEPHTLGWFHQHFGQLERDRSNRAHVLREQKHRTQTDTTQLYTPRWIADFLATHALDTLDPAVFSTNNPHTLPTICDPAVGGAQMLLAAFDALIQRGAHPADALTKLHGTDLDPRAIDISLRTLALHLARHLGTRDPAAEATLRRHLHHGDALADDTLFNPAPHHDVHPAPDAPTQRLAPCFDLVLTNPPYMGARAMPPALKARLARDFPPFHLDLYTAFIRRCHQLARHAIGILAQQTLWYLSRFEPARAWLLAHSDLVEFLHLGSHAFAALSGEKASTAAFILKIRTHDANTPPPTRFIDLRDVKGPQKKREIMHLHGARHHVAPTTHASVEVFDTLPGRPLAHWLPADLRAHFAQSPRLADLADVPGSQNKTGKNAQYVRTWHEIPPEDLHAAPEIIGPHGTAQGRWVFYSKGGPFAPWWGNWQHVVDWSDAARDFYAQNRTSSLLDETHWFREGICYTDFGGRRFNARWMPPGCVFDMTGPAIFPHDPRPDHLFALLAVLNSEPARELLNALNPSLHYQVRDVRNLPIPPIPPDLERELATHARHLVEGCRLLAAQDPQSPESLRTPAPDPAQLADFQARRPTLEAHLHHLVCGLYRYAPAHDD